MRRRNYLLLALGLAQLTASCRDRPPDAPPPAGEYVADNAAIVPAQSVERMNDLLGALQRDTDIEFVAASVGSLQGESIAGFTNRLFDHWKLGSSTRGNRGLLLVIAEKEEQVRLEVSYELEGVLTDAFVSYVEHQQMVPYFQQRRVGEGIEATVELVADRIYQRIRDSAYDPLAQNPETIGGFRSGGAGADTRIPLSGDVAPPPAQSDAAARAYFGAQPTPQLAWERFLELNRRRVKDPELGIYDAAAKNIVRRVNSNAGQDHIAKLYAGAVPTIRVQGDRAAVVFLDDPDHRLAPWFFRRGAEGWQLDGGMYPDAIGYNHRNQWFFRRRSHPYGFAFRDFRLDRHGFAHRRK